MRFAFDPEDIQGCDKVMAAEEEKKMSLEDIVEDKSDALAEDFDYVMSGLEKLCRDDKCQDAINIIDTLSNAIAEAISSISDKFADGDTYEE